MTGLRKRSSAQDESYAWLKRHIASLPPHEGVFLTEGEVAQQAGTSRTPVREALLRLEAQGFLQILPKKGAYVPPISDRDVEAVMQARGLVEDWCVRRIAGSADGLADELDEVISKQETLVSDPLAFIDCDRQFHRTMVQAAGNPVLLDFYESLRDRQVRMGIQAVTSTEGRARQVLAEHGAIAQGLRRLDPKEAASAVAGHLEATLRILHLPFGTSRKRSVTDPGGER